MTFEIEKNVTVPAPHTRGESALYPLEDMEPGDRFVVPYKEDVAHGKQAQSVRSRINGRSQYMEGVKFSIRAGDDGVYVYRVDGLPGYED